MVTQLKKKEKLVIHHQMYTRYSQRQRKPTGKKVGQSVPASDQTTDLIVITKEKQYRGRKDNNNRRTNSWLAKAQGLKEGEDILTMILEYDESQGGGEKGRQKSFYCTQEHDPKLVGNHDNPKKNTICTEGEMKVVDRKADLSFYNLTHQTCSVKNKNCIFVAGKFFSV